MSVNDELEAVVTAVKHSRKYRDTSETTIRDLAINALRHNKKQKKAIKAVRAQLHSIMAPYLGDPDYESEEARLVQLFASEDETAVREACQTIMAAHLSTRERLPILADFYEQIFAVTGKPESILDLACGLNPLALPWMGLAKEVKYHAYDIHEPRIQFINHFFRLYGLPPLARSHDIALDFPSEQADVALFLKEMPRFERNYHGQGRPLLASLQVPWLVISYPSISTHGGRNLTNRYREFMFQLTDGHDWPMTELSFPGELVFCVQKGSVV